MVITLPITENQITRARKLYSFKELRGSITKGESNIYGALGEIIFYDLLVENDLDVDINSTYDYDLIVEGYKVDMKTKKTTVFPESHYLCSIPAFNTSQNCDYYAFIRVHENLRECYILGYKSKEEFFSEAIFRRKGDIDVNGWTFKADCYNLEIAKLSPIGGVL